MKKLLVIIFFLVPIFLKAQDYPLGKSKKEIREIRKKSEIFIVKESLSDTCDVIDFPGDWQAFFYYRNNICYKIRQAYSIFYTDTIKKLLNSSYKAVKENIWSDRNEAVKLELIADKDKNKCVIEISYFDKKRG